MDWVDKFNKGEKEQATEVRLSPISKGWHIEADTVEEETIERDVDWVEIKQPAYDKIYKTIFKPEGIVRVVAKKKPEIPPITVKFFKSSIGTRGVSLYLI